MTFNDYVQKLDDGNGSLDSYPGDDLQHYQTRLNDSQVADVQKQPWLQYIYSVPDLDVDTDDAEDNRALLTDADHLARRFAIPSTAPYAAKSPLTRDRMLSGDSQPLHKRASGLSKRAMVERTGSDAHLKLLAAQPGSRLPPLENYRYDDSLGRGITIFVVDTGFNTDAVDLQPVSSGRTIGSFVVENEYTMPYVYDHRDPNRDPLLQDLTDRTNKDDTSTGAKGHGTGVASAAGGLVHGVASNANLYLIKAKNGWTRYRDGVDPKVQIAKYQVGAVARAFSHIRDQVRTNNLKGKAVVNLSWGLGAETGEAYDQNSETFAELNNFLVWCNNNDVVLVTATGNGGLLDRRCKYSRHKEGHRKLANYRE